MKLPKKRVGQRPPAMSRRPYELGESERPAFRLHERCASFAARSRTARERRHDAQPVDVSSIVTLRATPQASAGGAESVGAAFSSDALRFLGILGDADEGTAFAGGGTETTVGAGRGFLASLSS